MITNAREYQITRAQVARLASALGTAKERPVPEGVDPRIHTAELASIESEIERLQNEIALYDGLVKGSTVAVEVSDLERLPEALIQARIANGWNQKQLAERLGVHEQQVQRYEASRYRGASFERLLDIARTLGVRINQTVVFAAPALGKARATLRGLGFDDEFLEERITGADDEDSNQGSALDRILHVFNWTADQLSGSSPISFPAEAMGAARFRLPEGRDPLRVEAYATYAYRLALGAASCARSFPVTPVPSDAKQVRRHLLDRGEVSLRTIVDWAWTLGVVIIPLHDPGAFNGAFWRIAHRNVIILKQRTASAERLMHDALHELFHASQEPTKPQRVVVDTEDYFASRDAEEEAATEFASDVLLDGRANDLAVAAAASVKMHGPALKKAVQKIATSNAVSVGALANHLAWILSKQDPPFNWWGPATNLQSNSSADYQYAREMAFARLSAPDDAGLDEELLFRALRSEV